MNNIPISYGNNTTTQPIQWTSMSLSIKISSWQIISRSHSRLSSTLTLNSSKTILKRLNATDNAQALRKCNIPRSVQLVARKHSSQNAQRRLHLGIATRKSENSFQHTAARRRLLLKLQCDQFFVFVSTHSHPKVAARRKPALSMVSDVSTHSRPKAAAMRPSALDHDAWWVSTHSRAEAAANKPYMLDPQLAFQHTAARRRLRDTGCACSDRSSVSTHSRTKAAARFPTRKKYRITVSTHSRPKVAAKHGITSQIKTHVSTHSHPKAAAMHQYTFHP